MQFTRSETILTVAEIVLVSPIALVDEGQAGLLHLTVEVAPEMLIAEPRIVALVAEERHFQSYEDPNEKLEL